MHELSNTNAHNNEVPLVHLNVREVAHMYIVFMLTCGFKIWCSTYEQVTSVHLMADKCSKHITMMHAMVLCNPVCVTLRSVLVLYH
jgi:hypothetical protein